MTAETHRLSQLLVPELEAELAKTRRALERVPEDQLHYRPHEKSKSLLELANHLATVSGLAAAILTHPGVDLGGPQDPRKIVKEASLAPILEQFDALSADSLAQLRATSDAAFDEPWQATAQGNVLFSGPRYLAYRNIAANHLIHHRAQLGTYLRALHIPVPSSFGPTADEGPR